MRLLNGADKVVKGPPQKCEPMGFDVKTGRLVGSKAYRNWYKTVVKLQKR